jgi:hypothetical protein
MLLTKRPTSVGPEAAGAEQAAAQEPQADIKSGARAEGTGTPGGGGRVSRSAGGGGSLVWLSACLPLGCLGIGGGVAGGGEGGPGGDIKSGGAGAGKTGEDNDNIFDAVSVSEVNNQLLTRLARLLHASYTAYTPLTRHLHASYAPLPRLVTRLARLLGVQACKGRVRRVTSSDLSTSYMPGYTPYTPVRCAGVRAATLELKASYTSSLRPLTLVAYGLTL